MFALRAGRGPRTEAEAASMTYMFMTRSATHDTWQLRKETSLHVSLELRNGDEDVTCRNSVLRSLRSSNEYGVTL